MPERTIPSISVVMPAYNAAKYLREAIDSILAQTYTDFEFIIINDGSTDSTKDIIMSYDDPRIVYLENDVNSGIVVTLNKGLDAAQGRYIARMDADDISLPTRLAEQFAFMEANPDIAVAGCLVERFDDNGWHDFPPSEKDHDICKADLLFSTCVAHPATIIRKSILDKHHLRYDEHFVGMEDYCLWWRISRISNITNLQKRLLKYRQHKDQVTKAEIDHEFLDKQRKFISKQFEDLKITFSPEDVDVFLKYKNSIMSFDDHSLLTFIRCLQRILVKIKPTQSYYKAQKIVIGKAISFAYGQSSANIRKSDIYYMFRSYIMSCMSLTWILKRLYHKIK